MKEIYRMYNRMVEVFIKHSYENDYYDVDMFCYDLCKNMFRETDPQDIEEDDYLMFQEALILLVRDDMLLNWFGLSGLCILHTEMMDKGEHHYMNKETFDIIFDIKD